MADSSGQSALIHVLTSRMAFASMHKCAGPKRRASGRARLTAGHEIEHWGGGALVACGIELNLGSSLSCTRQAAAQSNVSTGTSKSQTLPLAISTRITR